MSNNIKKNLDTSNFINFSKIYLNLTQNLLKNVDLNELEKIVNVIEDSSKNNNTIYTAGNGGSASTASTFVNDIGFDVFKRSSNNKKIKIISLNDNISSLTAISNDISYDSIFKSQLKIHFQENDILIVFSGSGNSKNLIKAVEWIKNKSIGITIGFLGFNGGELGQMCDYSMIVESPKGVYGPVEDLHLIFNHLISLWLQSK